MARSLSGWVANDVFYLPTKTDQYYTAGFGATYRRRFTTGRRIDWGLRQAIFTPRNIEADTLLPNDRPFASYLVATYGWQPPARGEWEISHEVTGGILGKYSGGGEVQNFYHSLVQFAEELEGWKYEVASDVVLNYSATAERRWRLSDNFSVAGRGRGRLGTLFTDATGGAGLRFTISNRRGGEVLRAGTMNSLRLVVYNATLTGGLLNRDDRYRDVVAPRRAVHVMRYYVGLSLGRAHLTATAHHLAPEFRGGRHHNYVQFSAVYTWPVARKP